MEIIKVKPTSNSLRHHIKISKFLLLKNNRLIKHSLTKKVSNFGRSSQNGRITSWHKQRGAKRLYRKLDLSNKFKQSVVLGSVYDPNRSSFLTLNFELTNKKFFYNVGGSAVCPGTLTETTGYPTDIKLGNRLQLKNIPTGSIVHSIGLNRAVYARSAGTCGQIIQLDKQYGSIKLPSNQIIRLSVNAYATLGSVSNLKHNLVCIGKAGRQRNLGRRPTVRGIAMNPVDHPHGGRTNGGRPSVTPWGLPTKGGFYLKKKYGKV